MPINTTTHIKAERMAKQKHSQPLSFLKAQIRFSAGDSVDILSRTDGGVRLLCFAAILVSWGIKGIQSAELLESLFRQTSKPDPPLPTLLQLNDLLRALRPKLLESGLLTEVIGWYYWCLPSRESRLKPYFDLECLCTPSRARIQQLVDTLSQCFRVGEDSSSVRVEWSRAHIPWIIAGVKWMLGKPPNAWGADGSRIAVSDLAGVTVVEKRGQGSCFSGLGLSKSGNQLILVEGGLACGKDNFMSGLINVELWSKLRNEAL